MKKIAALVIALSACPIICSNILETLKNKLTATKVHVGEQMLIHCAKNDTPLICAESLKKIYTKWAVCQQKAEEEYAIVVDENSPEHIEISPEIIDEVLEKAHETSHKTYEG